MNLQHPSLLRSAAYVNGNWIPADSGERFPVHNPFSGVTLGEVPDLGAAETERAVSAAQAAFPAWSTRPAGERSALLRRWHDLLHAHRDDLALLMTSEQGKPLSEARGEVTYGASFLEWFAEEGRRAYGDVIPSHRSDSRILTIKQAVGVVAAITPWNFPIAMITRKVAPALAAGCTVVVKPAEDTPLCALALAYLAAEAGFPAGVFNVVTTSRPREVGQVLTSDPRIRKLSFTGSTATGKALMEQSAATLKRLSLELGGNAPFIVFDDADIEGAVAGAMVSKYRNGGQTCVCANRIYVQSGIYDAVVAALHREVATLSVGEGTAPGTDIGPLINTAALEKVEGMVADAVEKGARVVLGGGRSDAAALCYQPTLLLDANATMDLAREEIFGPVAPVFRFDTEAEVISLANDTPYGLAAYFYGRDHARIWRVAEALEYGMVGINTGLISTTVAPFGGVKESGFGREGSKYGLDDYLTIKYLCWGGIGPGGG
ncbi:succinate-semialdehyde dehydrogenase/glutarate-semialdehyde dehydrogenase [Lewinella marina]|uniref:Succinate-semialdehyde dehydrogenase (NADP(+)) n=1 Tax=Neolewinella marina TaxID=438751 RepID=A0A2G0CHD0_9BACT|nr:NAD-dependent succinate-semialdehyde dehydrogenase [Neolewinella marina]NJB86154.1 succinate-semialdehyde dehydrogenase/glutarate-semialdehyde dehydrogenase [Neolewinella marina]PHK99368.1 succinate-semialdehyde dehydrogenase (NADP(+)) [Neolewinella marina]